MRVPQFIILEGLPGGHFNSRVPRISRGCLVLLEGNKLEGVRIGAFYICTTLEGAPGDGHHHHHHQHRKNCLFVCLFSGFCFCLCLFVVCMFVPNGPTQPHTEVLMFLLFLSVCRVFVFVFCSVSVL